MPEIPYGYKRVTGQSQRGDGIWDSAREKFVKVRKEWPWADGLVPRFVIRKCVVEQTVIPEVAATTQDWEEA